MKEEKCIWSKPYKLRSNILRKPSKEKVKGFFVDFAFLFLACAIGAFSLTAVLLPNGLTSGGLTGLVRMVQKLVPIDFSILYYGGSLIIFVLVIIFLGLKEAKKILLLTVMYPAVLMAFEYLPFELLEEKDVILAAIFCGIFSGLCSGIVFWRGYSFCGSDAIAKIIRKKFMPSVPLSKIMLAIDGTIIICSAFMFGRNIALYALVTQVISSKMIDVVLFGFETKIVQLEIISECVDEVAEYIMKDIGRGVTEINVVGEYTKNVHRKLLCLCSPRESVLIRRFVAERDRRALVTVIHVDTVWGSGEGFRDINQE